ncbi:MAG: VWA domain-containing protein [Planctomycetes bacterium]|nr:VWA domain-containing protein [Planctomycetota bacterium]
MNTTKLISIQSVVATTGLSVLAAGTVLLSTTIAIASPGSNTPPSNLPQISTNDLDLPVMRPVYGKPAVNTPDDRFDIQLGDVPGGTPPWPAPLETPGETTPPPAEGMPPVFFGEEIPFTNPSVIYVIDDSGSMTMSTDPFVGVDGTVQNGSRLDRAKAELARSINALPETFQFNVVFYDECAFSCWDSKQRATADNKAAALGWVSAIQPDGWTNTGLAVATALADKGNTTVVLLSDGAPNFLDCTLSYAATADEHRQLISSTNTQGARINCFGIGISSDPSARSFMQQVAADSGGSYTDVN